MGEFSKITVFVTISDFSVIARIKTDILYMDEEGNVVLFDLKCSFSMKALLLCAT